MSTALCGVILVGTLCCSSSVRLNALQPIPKNAKPPGGDLIPKSRESSREVSDHLPGAERYARMWSKRYQTDKHLNEPMSSSIQLVLGIFTVPLERDYRTVVRRTWLNQTGLCGLESGPREGCSVYAAFVMGNRGIGYTWKREPLPLPRGVTAKDIEAARREPNVLLLDIEENMNSGKTPTWFVTALQRFPWATHIGKIDMDTFPFLHKLVHRMAEGRSGACRLGPYEFVGAPDDRKAGNFSASCPRAPCDRFAPQKEVWHHMSGQFYALSTPLVEKIDWFSIRGSGEDCVTTRLVVKASRDHKFCVVPRALDSWYHGGKDSDPDFANRF